MSKLNLEFLGNDRLGRPVYQCQYRHLYKDANFGQGEVVLHRIDNFDEEPNNPVNGSVKKGLVVELEEGFVEIKLPETENEVKFLLEVAGQLGWGSVEDVNNSYTLMKNSPEGQDFNLYVEGIKDGHHLVDSLYEYYDSFDVSEETYIWLDSTGHGANGAPYHMEDVLSDMKACEEMILKLYEDLAKALSAKMKGESVISVKE